MNLNEYTHADLPTNVDTAQFSPDFGLAIRNGKFANSKHITLTAMAFQGMPISERGGKTELTIDVMYHFESVIVPVSLKVLKRIIKR